MKRNEMKKPLSGHGRLVKFLTVSLALSFFSCGFSKDGSQKKESLKIVNWNLQTFFDAKFDGNEYDEYKSSKSGWNLTKYEERLNRLATAIKELDADVFVMEELEKEAQLQDIANQLSGTFNFSKLYKYAVFTTGQGSSIGCAVLSRYPIDTISVHTLDCRSKEKQPPMRPIMQFSIYKNKKSLTIFVNHWKSKSGGEEISEFWRNKQEKMLARLMKKAKGKNRAVLATGDFNKDISEFETKLFPEFQGKGHKENVILHGEENIEVYSPWILENGNLREGGSYWYKNKWERIDHFFTTGEIELTDFRAENAGAWAYEDGHPRRYQLWNGKGYSDHLPISCTVRF